MFDGLEIDIAGSIEGDTVSAPYVVVLNHACPDVIRHVLLDGVPVLENDRSVRILFEVYSRAEYFDVLPYIKEHHHTMGSPQDRP